MTKNIVIISFLLSGFCNSVLMAQEEVAKTSLQVDLAAVRKERGLQVGDAVPDIKFQMLNYPKPEVKLSDFKGKLVILDFWGTWCRSCIANFPKAESLQSTFKNKVQILLVNSVKSTGDKLDKVDDFINKRKQKGFPIKLGTAVLDTIAYKLFPHRELPHYVWISASGKVQAITSSHEVNESNILKSLNDENARLTTKIDFLRNKIFNFGEIPIDKSTSFFYFKRGQLLGIENINRGRVLTEINGGTLDVGRAMYNQPLSAIYQEAILASQDDSWNSEIFKRTILDVSDSNAVMYDSSRGPKAAWERDNLYSCDIIVPQSERNNLGSYFLDHLNKSSGYEGRIEKRKVKCLIVIQIPALTNSLSQKSDSTYLLRKNKSIFSNESIPSLIGVLNSTNNFLPLIVDGTNSTSTVNIAINIIRPDLLDIKKQLNKQGFDIQECLREMEMFVLSDSIKKDDSH